MRAAAAQVYRPPSYHRVRVKSRTSSFPSRSRSASQPCTRQCAQQSRDLGGQHANPFLQHGKAYSKIVALFTAIRTLDATARSSVCEPRNVLERERGILRRFRVSTCEEQESKWWGDVQS